MTNATVALLLTDLILGREHAWAPVFDPGRFTTESVAPVVKENLNAATHLIGDRFRVTREERLADVALTPGEGAVVRIDGRPVAVSRDAQGTLRAVSAICRHIGCYVAWNARSRPGTAPATGRYAADGTVLEGPANEDLEQVQPPDTAT